MVEKDCSNISLEAFAMYFKAISNMNVTLEDFSSDVGVPFPDTRTTIRLPKCTLGIEKRTFYKVALTHRALRYQLGTFSLDLPNAIYQSDHANVLAAGKNNSSQIGLENFFSYFSDPRLARFIFETLDGARIDNSLKYLLPGLATSLEIVRQQELRNRPMLFGLVPKAAVMEVLLQASLGMKEFEIPLPISAQCEKVCGILNSIDLRNTSSGLIAEATVRIYSVINSLPSLGKLPPSTQRHLNVSILSTEPSTIWPHQWPEPPRVQIEGDDILTVTIPHVQYRGTLEALTSTAPSASAPDHQAIYRLSSTDDEAREDTKNKKNGIEIKGPPQPLPHEHHDVARDLHTQEEGELLKTGQNTYLYREWDYTKQRYLNNWCRVVHVKPKAASNSEEHSLIKRYSKELNQLKRFMTLSTPDAFSVERRRQDGIDLDYDATVEALIDLRQGIEPSDNIYVDLVRQRRDVATLLLIDMSASTAERVTTANPMHLDLSLGQALGDKLRPPRILDIEIISSLLCSNAFRELGDSFSIWGFSGTGREKVQLSEIKSFSEQMSGRVVAKAAGIKPVHATRLGAAVRHCGAQLAKLQAETKILLVLTDGRPYDIDYGSNYGEERAMSYAIADSDKAFGEISKLGIQGYVLTVDASGEEYISMFENVHVEKLQRIEELPERIIRLYLSLIDQSSNIIKRDLMAPRESSLLQTVSGGEN